MKVKLAFGRSGLEVDLPEGSEVIQPGFVSGVPDEGQALRDALWEPIESPPLRDLITPEDTVVLVHTDITRATPNDRILPVLLEEIEAAGVGRSNITLLNGLGTHRPQSEAELRTMLGDWVVDHFRCEQHDCNAGDLVPLGETSHDHPVRINRRYMDASVKILTGFIEPHFFAGFSGGPKAILPSLAGVESVYSNHGLSMIADPSATWGITEGNPIWVEMLEVALRTDPTFLFNVSLNVDGEITGVYAGDLQAAHRSGCAFVRDTAMVPVAEPYDIVVTTNSGYPLDQNLYQSVKGMSAAAQIVRPGGAILIAAACEDGLPDHGEYASLLTRGGSPEGVLEMISQPGFQAGDQWQVQIQAQIQQKAQVYIHSEGLTDRQIQDALFQPCADVSTCVRQLAHEYGESTRICVLPEGPQTIPYLTIPGTGPDGG
jgi:nickel-dependent lactate racemase